MAGSFQPQAEKPAVVTRLPSGAYQFICPNCGRERVLSGPEERGETGTKCSWCTFNSTVDWRDWMTRHMVKK